jgi:hypothetical protein
MRIAHPAGRVAFRRGRLAESPRRLRRGRIPKLGFAAQLRIKSERLNGSVQPTVEGVGFRGVGRAFGPPSHQARVARVDLFQFV